MSSRDPLYFIHSGRFKLTVNLELLDHQFEQEHGQQLRDAIKDEVSYAANNIAEEVRSEIDRYNPDFITWASNWRKRMPEVFTAAGFLPIYAKEIPDQYSKRKWMPWFIVTTFRGHFKVGWRKRVIEIDWSDTDIGTLATSHLFENEDVTKDGKLIHAWSYDKMQAYLAILKGAP